MKEILENEYFITFYETISYLIAGFILFFIGKIVYQLFHSRINIKAELVDKDNFAFATAHTGYFVGLLLAIGSAISGPSTGFINDLKDIALYGLMSVILLNLSILINEKIILRKFSVHDEIVRDQNTGTGVIEAASAISTGLILFGAITGESGSWLTALIFWIVGQALLVLTTIVYGWITPYNVHEHIEKDNVAVGIGFAGAMIAIANLIRFALMPEFEDWTSSLLAVLIDTAIGLIFLPLARLLADKILLPGRNLTDEIVNQEKPNNGAALIEAFAYIGGSILITWCL